MHYDTSPTEIIKPPAIRKGDRIGLIAPASSIDEHEDIALGKEIVQSLGFGVEIAEHAGNKYGYLAGSDEERARDVNEMFRRDDIHGIISIRGGWGTSRILPMLDYEMIRQHAKVFMGYSDITSLLLAIYKNSGVVTFHGPVALSTFSDYTMEYLTRAIIRPQPIGNIKMPTNSPDAGVERENRLLRLGKGKGTGILVGGNLSLFVTTLGTPYEIDTAGKILFLEEVGEEPYRVDRMLTHLWLAKKLQPLSGLVIGKLTNCRPNDYKPAFSSTLSIEEILRTRIEPMNIPAIYGAMIGHVKDKVTIPLGIRATLDAEAGTLAIEENAVT